MCVVSMVHDFFGPRIPPAESIPWTTPSTITFTPAEQKVDLDELRKLIEDFKQAMAAAKVVDEKTAQPDCLDPNKAGLEERVAELERRLNGIDKPKKRRGRK